MDECLRVETLGISHCTTNQGHALNNQSKQLLKSELKSSIVALKSIIAVMLKLFLQEIFNRVLEALFFLICTVHGWLSRSNISVQKCKK